MPSFPYAWFNLSDSAIGELSAAVGTGDTTFVLKTGQGAKFPSAGFIFRIENEWVYCGTRTNDTLSSLTRGFDGSTAATHAANTTVFQAAGKTLFQRIYDQITGHTHPLTELGTGTPGSGNFLRGDGTWNAPSGGSDPWTYVRLTSNFQTSSASAVDVTGMSLSVSASTRYEIQGQFLLRTATATVGPRLGVAWPTGMTDGVAEIDVTSAAGTRVLQQGNINAAVLAPVGGLPNTTQSWPGKLHATLIAGASPGSTFRIQLATETAATNVIMQANSWFRWRTF